MAIVAKVLSSRRLDVGGVQYTEVTVDLGTGENRRPRAVFAPPGVDAAPLPGDFAVLSATDTSGRLECLGFFDPNNADITLEGELRGYSRGEGGAIVAELHLKRDGRVTLFNANGSVTLADDGAILGVSPGGGVTLTAAGAFSASNDNGLFALDTDGAISGVNANGGFALQAGGDFVVNNVTITPEGRITTPSSIFAANVTASSSVQTAAMSTTTLTIAGADYTVHTHEQSDGNMTLGVTP